MNVNERLEHLRATLYEPASAQTWAGIVGILDAWPQDDGLEVGLDYADSHLAAWDDALREVPVRWRKTLFGGAPEPRCRVARRLRLSAMGGGDAAAHTIARSRELDHLTILEMAHVGITPVGCAALATSGALRGLAALDLGNNALGGKGVEALVGSGGTDHLRTLDLTGSTIGDDGVAVLVNADLPALRTLRLWGNLIGPAGAAALASAALIGQLDVLDLGWNKIADAGARALAQAPVTAPFELNISNNLISNDALSALETSETLRAAGAHLNTVLNGTHPNPRDPP